MEKDFDIEIMKLRDENEVLRHRQNEADLYYAKMKELELYQAELIKLLAKIEEKSEKVVILFEGRDAAGKGSLIGTIAQYLNPKHCRTVALGKPGARNAGILAVQILALSDPDLTKKLADFKQDMAVKVAEKAENLEAKLDL